MYNDPQLALQWPLPVSMISDKDRSLEAAERTGSRTQTENGVPAEPVGVGSQNDAEP